MKWIFVADENEPVRTTIKRQALVLFVVLATLWLLEIVDQFFLNRALDAYGIQPREQQGLRGILLAPLLHGDFSHLGANSGPLLILGWFVMWRRLRDFFYVWGIVALVAGLGTWLVGGTNSIHIGASGVVFGFLGYLLVRGWFDRKFWPIVGSIVIGVAYGGMLWGVLPGQPGISWEGHLFGFVGGVVAAWVLHRTGQFFEKRREAAAG